jgi:hypothetical protein
MVTHLSDDATRMRASSALPIARNTALLSASLAAHSAMIQLAAAVASITLIAGCGLAALGSARESALAVLAGLVGVGTANGATLLARTAAGDMYPPQRRARGIGLALFGAIFGAILGPAVFSPLLAGRDLDGDATATLWLAAGGFELVGMALVAAVRPTRRGSRPCWGTSRRSRAGARRRSASCCAAGGSWRRWWRLR